MLNGPRAFVSNSLGGGFHFRSGTSLHENAQHFLKCHCIDVSLQSWARIERVVEIARIRLEKVVFYQHLDGAVAEGPIFVDPSRLSSGRLFIWRVNGFVHLHLDEGNQSGLRSAQGLSQIVWFCYVRSRCRPVPSNVKLERLLFFALSGRPHRQNIADHACKADSHRKPIIEVTKVVIDLRQSWVSRRGRR